MFAGIKLIIRAQKFEAFAISGFTLPTFGAGRLAGRFAGVKAGHKAGLKARLFAGVKAGASKVLKEIF